MHLSTAKAEGERVQKLLLQILTRLESLKRHQDVALMVQVPGYYTINLNGCSRDVLKLQRTACCAVMATQVLGNTMISTEPHNTELDEDNIPSRKKILYCSFGLVIVDETMTVRFVHHSRGAFQGVRQHVLPRQDRRGERARWAKG